MLNRRDKALEVVLLVAPTPEEVEEVLPMVHREAVQQAEALALSVEVAVEPARWLVATLRSFAA